MSTNVAVNDSSTSAGGSNKLIAVALAVFAVIEGIAAYFLVMNPLYVKPVFAQRDAYNSEGVTCTVKLFGKIFASAAEKAENQIILSLLDTIINIVLIYIIITGSVLLLAFFFMKGFAFAKTYLIAVFGGKAIFGLVPLLIPFEKITNMLRIYGIADAVICIAACGFFLYLNALEHADDMMFTDDQMKAMKKRGIFGAILFVAMLASMILESRAMLSIGGGNWTVYLGWEGDTGIAQGVVLVLIAAVSLVAAACYVLDADWALYFFFAFGAAVAVSDIVALVIRIMNVGVSTSTVMLIGALLTSAFAAVLAFTKIKDKLFVKPEGQNKKAVIALLVSVGSIVLSFILTVAAVTMLDRQVYGTSFALGAMDFMYFIVYGGITLFLAAAMLGGFSFTRFGTLGLYLVVASTDFECIFLASSLRQGYITTNPGTVGYNYIIAMVLFVLALVSCFGIIAAFVIKDVSNYMYQKRYS